MRKFILVGIALLAGGSCASPSATPWVLPHHTESKPTAQAAAAPAPDDGTDLCPTASTEVKAEQCADLPDDYGLTPENPVEWGLFAAGGNQRKILYFGRLLCADGTPAYATRGQTSANLIPSDSPLSITGKRGHRDDYEVIDHWKVECGDDFITLYSNIRRCGSPCAPKPFKLMSAKGREAQRLSREAQNEGRIEDFYSLAKDARDADPGSLSIQRTYIYTLFVQERFEDSLQAAEEALAAIPWSTDLRTYRLSSLYRLERFAAADQAADELLSMVEGTSDRNLGSTLCTKAMISKKLNRPDDEALFRTRACDAGEVRCCQSREEE